MNFKELLDRYKKGLVTEDEKQYIEKEIEKYETIEEYLSKIMDEEFDDLTKIAKAENYDEETFKLKKSVNNRLRKVIFASVFIVISLVITIFFVVSPLVDKLYYNPNKFTVANLESDINFDVYAISELNMPGLSTSTVSVDKQGFGEYDIRYLYRNVFTGVNYNVNHKIKRGSIVSSNKDPISNQGTFLDIRYADVSESYIDEKKQNVINHLKKLNPVTYVSMDIMFENDLTMEELYDLESKYPNIEFEWAGIRTSSPDEERINNVVGIQLKNSKSNTVLLGNEGQITDKYPAFFIMDWLVNPVGSENGPPLEAQAYKQHYISLLEYVIDRKDAVKVLEHRPDKYEFYKSALEYAKEQGVHSYGVLLFAEVEDLLDMLNKEKIKGLELNNALVSKSNIN